VVYYRYLESPGALVDIEQVGKVMEHAVADMGSEIRLDSVGMDQMTQHTVADLAKHSFDKDWEMHLASFGGLVRPLSFVEQDLEICFFELDMD